MARAARLKVFRTAIGFHDAYVAAPSRKAALEAWGTQKDLFARGQAEIVTDARLSEAPLAAPGTIVKLLRGTAAEQVAALPPASAGKRNKPARAGKPADPPPPRPDRAGIESAERAIEAARVSQRDATRRLDERERALVAERAALERVQANELAGLEAARDEAERRHALALAEWTRARARR